MKITNRQFAENNEAFRHDCNVVNEQLGGNETKTLVAPTTRQASKYRLRKGIVYKMRRALK